MSNVIHLNDENYKDTIEKGISIVDFWAPWCGPCRMIGPTIEELAKEFDGKVKICKVNTDEQNNIAKDHGIRSIPTIQFYKDGNKVDEWVGAQSKARFIEKINSLLKE